MKAGNSCKDRHVRYITNMVTLEGISMQLTKPIKELAEWDYPFSKTLEAYYSLFNDTSNKSFNNAGLVLQNSTAVYVHRVDYLWNKTALIRNLFFNYELEAENKKLNKKKDRSVISFENFETINFAEEIDKNIDIKKSNITQESVKLTTRCFTQLEKGIAQHIPIDIYDVNGEIIGKKYDFRCNQDISTNGVLIDEFAPEDFEYNDDSAQEKSTSISSQCSHATESLEHSSNTTGHDSSDKNITSDEESERNDSPEEASDLIESLDSSQNLSNSTDSITDTAHSSTTDNLHDQNSTNDTANESQCTSHSDTNLPSNTVDSSAISNNNADAQSLKNNIGTNAQDTNDQLDSTTKSINSQERTPSMENLISLEDANKDAELPDNFLQIACMFQGDSSVCFKYIQKYNPLQYDPVTDSTSTHLLGYRSNLVESCDTTTSTIEDTYESVTLTEIENEEVELYRPSIVFSSSPSSSSSNNKIIKIQSRRKFTPKTLRKGRVAKKFQGKGNTIKNLLSELQKEAVEDLLKESVSSETNRLSMFQQDLDACMKCIQEYDPLRYDHMTNEGSDFLGFRLHIVEACDLKCDDATDNVMVSVDFDDDRLDYSPRAPCSSMSPEHEIFCDPYLQPNASGFLSKNIEKWHELLQPKLREAERRSKFSIHYYTSRIIEYLRTNTQRQINIDDAIPKEEVNDVARYFLASLDLAARQKVDLMRSIDPENNIRITLYEEDRQYSRDDQADSHD